MDVVLGVRFWRRRDGLAEATVHLEGFFSVEGLMISQDRAKKGLRTMAFGRHRLFKPYHSLLRHCTQPAGWPSV